MNVAIIPARGGSKRIPRKNIRDFLGKPMIAWSIDAAIQSQLFDRVIVSTDDQEIREISLAAGAETPFQRPQQLADDHAPTLPVIRHAVEWLESSGCTVSSACCIYATAPFLQTQYLKEGYDALRLTEGLDFAFSVTPFGFPIFRALKMGDAGEISMIWPEHELTRSQDLPHAYHDAGQFYWGTGEAWRQRAGIYSSRTQGIVIPPHLVQDIDSPDDWKRAELMAKALQHD